MLASVQELLTIIATGVGSFVALSGLSAWKREHTGKRDIELCQQVIENFYEAEQNIRMLRSPISNPEHESKNRPPVGSSESKTEKQLRNMHYVPLARLQDQSDFWNAFFSRKFRMRAIFGSDATKSYDIVDEVLRTFRAAAITKYNSISENKLELEGDLSTEFNRIIWQVSDDDELGKKIKTAIEKMENICTPIVQTRRPIFAKCKWFKK